MFYALFVTTFGTVLAVVLSRGDRPALWACWPAALLLLPNWISAKCGALFLDLRLAVVLALLAGWAMRPELRPQGPWLVSDLLVLVLNLAQVVSEYLVGKFGVFSIPEVARVWLLPYLMGRWFLGSTADLTRFLPAFVRSLLAVAAYAVVEAVIKVNPINLALGKTYGILEGGEGYRMGLKRAQAMTDHPIYFGMILVLFLPWAIEAARQGHRGAGPKWWRGLPWVAAAALFVTVSRGPQLAALAAAFLAFFLYHRRWRLRLIGLMVVGALVVLPARQAILESLSKVANESEENTRIIMINGEEEEYTGTRHRILLFKVYADALANAGLFGWGNDREGIVLEEDLARRFGSIDSHYILFYLQRGYSGIVPFVLLSVCSLGQLLRLAWRGEKPQSSLAGALFAALLAVDLNLFSVWLAPDYGTVWLFSTGLAANLAALTGRAPAPVPELALAAPAAPVFPLVPVHAPIRKQSENLS